MVRPAEENVLGIEAVQAMFCPYVTQLVKYIEKHIPPNLRSRIDPQDVVQDTLFEAFRTADQFALQGPDSVWRWLVTIAHNRLINLADAAETTRRDSGRRVKGIDETEHGTVIEILHELASLRRTPSKSAARRELLLLLDASIDRLDPPCREAICLRFFDDLPVREIAVKMNRSEDAVQRLFNRGLKALRVELHRYAQHV